MKKFFAILLACLTIICLAGCGTYVPPTGSDRPSFGTGSGNKPGGDNPGTDPGEGGDDPSLDEYDTSFTVTLVNAPATLPEDMQAVWTRKKEVYTANFVDGVATVDGLDGDYHVTLTNLPSDYTYDCNGYTATNVDKDIKIELLEIIKTKEYFKLTPQYEEDDINWYRISKYGTYRATLKSASDIMGFCFKPSENGSFSITSWCDITANAINPVFRQYSGGEYFCHFIKEVDGGSDSGTFTKNFRFAADFGDENIGAQLMFTVRAAVNGVQYPVTVDFTIKREAEYQLPDVTGEPYYADGPFCKDHETGSWRYIYEDNTSVSGGNTYYIQDADKVVYNPNDKYYHVGTIDGPLLYAKLTQDCQVFITATVPGGAWLNKGFSWNELADGMVNLSLEDGFNYSYMINKGYASYCDSNGAHPVTEEIKTFLQGYASRENYFRDGEGWAEDPIQNQNDFTNQSGLRLQSDEKSMWLFACGYYKK